MYLQSINIFFVVYPNPARLAHRHGADRGTNNKYISVDNVEQEVSCLIFNAASVGV